MAVPQAVISYDLSEMDGSDLLPGWTWIRAYTNIPTQEIIDTSSGAQLLGDAEVQVPNEGIGSITVPRPGGTSNPGSWQTSFQVRYRLASNPGVEAVRTYGPFTITGDATLGSLVGEQEIPPSYVSALLTSLQDQLDAAAASAAEAAADRAAVEAVVIGDLGTTDGQTRTLLETDGTLTKAALLKRLALEQSGLGFTTCLGGQTAIGANSLPRTVFNDGLLYGANGITIRRTADLDSGWTDVVTLPAGQDINDLKETGNGEVLVVRGTDGLWRSSGWTANPATSTWTKVLDTGGAPITSWSWSVEPVSGWVTVTTYIGTGDMTASNLVWLSTNRGASFATIFNMATTHPGLAAATSHLHHATVDPYKTGTPRVWVTYHKTSADPTYISSPLTRIIYSDNANAGTPTWNVYDSEANTTHHPVVCIPTVNGVIFDTDTDPVALYVVRSSAAGVPQPRELLHMVRRGGLFPMHGWGIGFSASRSMPGVWHVAFKSDVGTPGYPGCVITTDGIQATETLVLPPTTSATAVELGRPLEFDDQLVLWVVPDSIGAPSTRTLFRGTIPKRGAAPDPKPGGLEPGTASSLGAAGGYGSQALTEATAYGVDSSADVEGVAIGHKAAAGLRATAVGESSSVTAEFGTGYGRLAEATDGLSVGHGAKSTGEGTAIGKNAKAGTLAVPVSQGTAVGDAAQATGDQATAVGRGATAIANATALGRGATASGSASVALGRAAVASHSSSTAIGNQVSTTANSQVAVGAKHFEILEFGADPAAGPADSARFFARDDGQGKTQFCVRFASGNVLVLATQDVVNNAAIASGTATLPAGTVTIASTRVTANSAIRVVNRTIGGTPGALYVSARSVGTSFTVSSTSGTDTSVIYYEVLAF